MENPNTDRIVSQLCDLQREQFMFSQELLLSVAAIQEVMKDRGYADFQSDHQKKIQALKQGALGKQIAQDIEAFGKRLHRVKLGLL